MKKTNIKKKVQVVVVRYDQEEQNWFVLLLRTNKKRGQFWQNVTGSIEKVDLNFRRGAIRELAEETGIKGKDLLKCTTLKFQYDYLSKQGMTILEKCFIAVVKKDRIKIDPKEHNRYEWKLLKKVKRQDYEHALNFKATRLAAEYCL
jgi:8-oxo-dGTP pyrophosphatase MutT (NUDIX family)